MKIIDKACFVIGMVFLILGIYCSFGMYQVCISPELWYPPAYTVGPYKIGCDQLISVEFTRTIYPPGKNAVFLHLIGIIFGFMMGIPLILGGVKFRSK